MDEETHGCGYNDVLERDLDCEFRWGPLGFSKFHHPLAIMVINYNVVTSLVFDNNIMFISQVANQLS